MEHAAVVVNGRSFVPAIATDAEVYEYEGVVADLVEAFTTDLLRGAVGHDWLRGFDGWYDISKGLVDAGAKYLKNQLSRDEYLATIQELVRDKAKEFATWVVSALEQQREYDADRMILLKSNEARRALILRQHL